MWPKAVGVRLRSEEQGSTETFPRVGVTEKSAGVDAAAVTSAEGGLSDHGGEHSRRPLCRELTERSSVQPSVIKLALLSQRGQCDPGL